MKPAVPPVLVSPLQPLVAVRSAALSTVAQQTAAHVVGPLGDRWPHTVGVAQCAAELADALALDADVLVAAAWLHDIGYARVARATGFPPLDGARYLAAQLWPMRIAGLVAHQSRARSVAAARGLDEALAGYPDENDLLADALTYADQTVDSRGRRTPCAHGPGCWGAEADHLRGPRLRAAVARIERGLARPTASG